MHKKKSPRKTTKTKKATRTKSMSKPRKNATSKDWESFFEQRDKVGVPDDFMKDRDRSLPQDRGDILNFADDDSEPLTDEDGQ